MKDTICAIGTLVGESSINLIRISGNDSIEIVNKIFTADLLKKETHTITYGFIKDGDEKVDEVLVSIFKGPKSFTKEDIVEINTHGGKTSVNRIMDILLQNGCRLAEPGEFLKRAFFNGRIDLVEAESVSDMINATTEAARKMSMKGISKELSNKINNLKEKVLSLIANIEVNIDYPEYEDAVVVTCDLLKKEMFNIKKEIKTLVDTSKNGLIIKNGLSVAIVGKPNVGKSSILNKLLGEDKAIVTDVKGTTRDIVEGNILINGINVYLYDTAGIRETDEIVESIGIQKSIKKIEEADLVLFVIDSSDKFSEEDLQVLEKLNNKQVLIVYNKIDLGNNKFKELEKYDYIEISSKKDDNIDLLKNRISELFGLDDLVNSDYTYISNVRQIGLLKECLKIAEDIEKEVDSDTPVDLIEINIRLLWEKLGEITGSVYKDELIDEIFSKFCLGK